MTTKPLSVRAVEILLEIYELSQQDQTDLLAEILMEASKIKQVSGSAENEEIPG